MRGAMLLDADTLERLDPNPSRGVRATYMDDADSSAKGTASGKNHYAEAIVLATKVQSAPGIVGEICVSDDPDYVTGYVATPALGYCRLLKVKEPGDPNGGRIFLYRGSHDAVSETIRSLEETPVFLYDMEQDFISVIALELRPFRDERVLHLVVLFHRDFQLLQGVFHHGFQFAQRMQPHRWMTI